MKKLLALMVAAGALSILYGLDLMPLNTEKEAQWRSIPVETGAFKVTIPATATIEPEHLILVNPPVAGRIDDVIIKEGDFVSSGQILAWMSSTDRAALIDAARAQGNKAVQRWKKEYRPTPIISPSSGQIIKRAIVSGQNVSNETTLFELSDRLVVRSRVDETDIGKIQIGQKAEIKVDAFPERIIYGAVKKIGLQSQVKDSITVYEVLLEVPQMPNFFRSGLTATVDFVTLEKSNTLMIPTWATEGVIETKVSVFVKGTGGEPVRREVTVGQSNGEFVEVTANLYPTDVLMYLPVSLKGGSKKGPLNIMGKKK